MRVGVMASIASIVSLVVLGGSTRALAAPVGLPAVAPVVVPSAEPASDPAPPDPTPIVGPPAGPPLSGEALAKATQTIASHLRCPVCQGLSVADSPSESAQAIKHEVERLAALGYSEAQCLLYFEASYGEFVLLEPKAEGLNLVVWAAPAGLLLAGLGLVAWMRLGNRPKTPGVDASASSPPVPLEFEPYVEQVYAAVGRPPSKSGRTP